MPIYEWACEHCGTKTEIMRPVRDALQPVICGCGIPMVQQLSAAFVVGDIAPYKAVTGDRAGQYITSRKEHREFLKRNRLVEVGDAKPRDTSRMRPVTNRREIREQMRPIVREALRNDKRRKA